MKAAIYIPGLANDLSDCSMPNYVKSFAHALDKNDLDKSYVYGVKFEKVAIDGLGEKEIDLGIIYRQKLGNSSNKEIMYKMYNLDYEEEFTAHFRNANIFKQSIMLFWGLFKMLPVFIRSLFYGPSLNGKQRFQSLYFFFIMVIVSLFTVMLIPSLLTILADNITTVKSGIKNALHQFDLNYKYVHLQEWFIGFKNFSKSLVVLFGIVAVFFPKVQKTIAITAIEYLCVHYYLKYGNGLQMLTGKLNLMVEKITETEQAYDDFEIHAYSFGSVIAIDTIFPKYNQPLDLRLRKEITQLLTIGSPFDFLRVYYSHYFKERNLNQTSIKNWVNVQSKLDVLSSNFRNDSLNIDSDVEITPGGISIHNISYEVLESKQTGLFDYLFLVSTRTHSMYWGENSTDSSFFTNYLNRNNNS